MINYIQQHATAIRNYQQPAIPWVYNRNGAINANVQYAQAHGALNGIAYADMTRHDVVTYFQQDLYRGFIATMLWGHKHIMSSKGFRTIVDANRNDIVQRLDNVKSLIGNGNIDSAFLSMCPGMHNKIDEVSFSFFTKLIYFMSKAFAPTTTPLPLIYDSHMVYVHCALLLDEFHNGHQLYKWREHSGVVWNHATKQCATEAYMDYINRMNNIAVNTQTSSENIEAFLFSLHPANPVSFVYQEVYNQRNLLP